MNEQNYYPPQQSALGRIISLWMLQVALLVLASLVLEICVLSPRPAVAQGNLYTVTHTLVNDWSQICAGITNTVVANTANGELRLAATVEDYFDGTTIDATRWYTNISNPSAGGSPAITVGGGLLTVDGMYLLSTAGITGLPRFFEARARLIQQAGTSGRPDVGYWRHPTLGPLYDPDINAGSSRVFIMGNTGGVGQDEFDLITGARSGETVILNDIETDPDLNQFHFWRIEWENTQARYYFNTILTDTMNINTTVITGWVFLYHQIVSSIPSYNSTPMTVDWVRGGQYPSSGTYVSCAIDGWGGNWNSMFWNSTVPGNTGLGVRTRASSDGVNWGAWSSVTTTNPFSITTDGRYLQYEVQMTSSNPIFSPEMQSISMTSVLGPSAVRLNDFQTRPEPMAWQWLAVLAAGAMFMGGLGLRMLRR
jgi:hypothetical protein